MSFWVYIIQSESTERFYCGHSSNPNRRLRQHNDSEYNLSKITKRLKGPWKIIYSMECEDRGKAMILEKSIKKRGIEGFLRSDLSVESR